MEGVAQRRVLIGTCRALNRLHIDQLCIEIHVRNEELDQVIVHVTVTPVYLFRIAADKCVCPRSFRLAFSTFLNLTYHPSFVESFTSRASRSIETTAANTSIASSETVWYEPATRTVLLL